MNWRDCIQRILRLNEEEIRIMDDLISQVQTRQLRQVIDCMREIEQEQMELLRELLNESGWKNHGDYYGDWSDPIC